MSQQNRRPETLTLTASLTTGIAQVAYGMQESLRLVDKILETDHLSWETTLYVGDFEYHTTKDGPFPNHQLRISVRPSANLAALNYTDHDDPKMTIANSYNPEYLPLNVSLIFNGTTGQTFPSQAAIPINEARKALREWLETRKRPTCIEWRSFDAY